MNGVVIPNQLRYTTIAILMPWSLNAISNPTETMDLSNGKEIYEQSCITCHGDDGAGGMPGVPDMTEDGGSLEKPDTELKQNIITGFQSPDAPIAMPARGGNPALTDDQIESVIAYMRHKFSVQVQSLSEGASK